MTSTIEKRRSLHQQLQQYKDEVESLSKQLERLTGPASIGTAAAMIAHEINNLLTPISNYAALALRNPDDKELAQKALKRAKDNCRRAAEVTESILGAVNGQNDQKQKVNLADLVEEVFSCLGRDFSKDQITVKKEIPPDLTVYTAQVKLHQVIMNLILNAREALLETNGGTLTVSAEDFGDSVKIHISDTGCGMSEEVMSRIFEPFFTTKSDDNKTSRRPGAGLGLALCSRIVEQQAGIISVCSEPNAGSTFTLTLPQEPLKR